MRKLTKNRITISQNNRFSKIRFQLGWARFAKKNFSLISEIKRIWIRFTCVSLFHYEISLLFFRFFSLIFASNFSLRFTWVLFASKRNKAKQNSSLFFHFFRFFSLFFAIFPAIFHFVHVPEVVEEERRMWKWSQRLFRKYWRKSNLKIRSKKSEIEENSNRRCINWDYNALCEKTEKWNVVGL